jgi:hypothetical protein
MRGICVGVWGGIGICDGSKFRPEAGPFIFIFIMTACGGKADVVHG